MRDGYLTGHLDNVLTAAILVYLFEIGFQGTAFFTAQEEAGRSWRYLLEWFRRFGGSTNDLVVLDTSPYPSREAADGQQVVLRSRDANASFNAAMTSQLEALCQAHGITYGYKDRYIVEQNERLVASGLQPRSIGSTEMGRIIAASDRLVDGTTLQIPTSGYHTMDESAAIRSCDALIELLSNVTPV
jgi:putative aminopeptidase FrvX